MAKPIRKPFNKERPVYFAKEQRSIPTRGILNLAIGSIEAMVGA